MIDINTARDIMGENFIGPRELLRIKFINRIDTDKTPIIDFSEDSLINMKDTYILIMGIGLFPNKLPVTIRNLKNMFGKDPDIYEPCFYNQDWYDHENFVDIPMENKWFLIKRDVYDESRAVQPTELQSHYKFPSAIDCTYAFFTVWLAREIKLWYHDFVWCNDIDHNGDRIYVGKYHDIDGINKNGFSIHRHLALKSCYGCIDFE